METRIHAAAGAACMAIGVGCGAFGAHALRDVVSPGDLQIWEKAVLYQLVHGLAALVVVRPQGIFGDKREQAFDVR